jgi:hypothetical protein
MEAATVAGRAAAPARVPRDRPAPGRKRARSAPTRKPNSRPKSRANAAAPARKTRAAAAPARRARAAAAPARKPATRPSPARRTGAQLIPIAAGAATAVRQFPDSNLMVRMTRGRLWIGVLGALLVGIVALNVFTLSLTAEAGHIDQNIVALEKENSILRSRDAQRSGSARIRADAGALGLEMAAVDEVSAIAPSRADATVAAQRLAAAGTGY